MKHFADNIILLRRTSPSSCPQVYHNLVAERPGVLLSEGGGGSFMVHVNQTKVKGA